MATMTKKKLIELIRESVEEHMAENCPADMEDNYMDMAPMEEPMMDSEESKMDQLLDMMQQVLMKLDGGEPMEEPPAIEMKESKRRRKTKK
tara:strand:- start:266 stop:538 length:273 start_codon:yes stop_codon:yes gene_type:complete